MITIRSKNYSEEDLLFLREVMLSGFNEICKSEKIYYEICNNCNHVAVCKDIKYVICHLNDLILRTKSSTSGE